MTGFSNNFKNLEQTQAYFWGEKILSSFDEPESEAINGLEHSALITFFLITSSAIKT